ncbi:MAG: class I SAM-dependent DNA methyltransferase [Culicoidibacterales bacterium]
MLSYGQFAKFYDELMADAPYEQWIAFVQSQVEQAAIPTETLVDLGCGTGTITIPLAELFTNVIGVDLSAEMLTIAQEKLTTQQQIQWIEADMSEMVFANESVDCITILCDSLNYVIDQEDVQTTLTNCYRALKPGGMLIFDVHTMTKIHEVFDDFSENVIGEDFSYIWNSFVLGEGEVEHELTFFVETDSGLYQRFDELHHQKTYPEEDYKTMISESGFSEICTYDSHEVGFFEPNMRKFFVCRK